MYAKVGFKLGLERELALGRIVDSLHPRSLPRSSIACAFAAANPGASSAETGVCGPEAGPEEKEQDEGDEHHRESSDMSRKERMSSCTSEMCRAHPVVVVVVDVEADVRVDVDGAIDGAPDPDRGADQADGAIDAAADADAEPDQLGRRRRACLSLWLVVPALLRERARDLDLDRERE